jgi:glucuronoarabinoxylan endo-1,4-beta-xylanase
MLQMKKTVCGAVIIAAMFVPASRAASVSVSWSQEKQTMDGFGACNSSNGALSDDVLDLFFDKDKGIGLSILRVAIDTNGSLLINSPSFYSGEVSNAQKAAALGAIVWGAPWSPPGEWKDNGDVKNGGHLLPQYYDAWASRLAGFATMMQQNNVPMYGISVQNEPEIGTYYASCIMTKEDIRDFIKVLGPKLAALNPRPKILAPEWCGWNLLWDWGTAAVIEADPTALSYLDIYAVHQYGGVAPYQPLQRPLWETEWYVASSSGEIGRAHV